MALFGLPFFGAGVFLFLTVIGTVPVQNADRLPPWAWLVLTLMAVLFTAVGATLVLGRSWVTLDLAQRAVLRQQGLLVPLREQRFPLGDYTAVTLGFIEGDSDTADRFPVGLKARSGTDLSLRSFTNYAESRAVAAAVARHLQFDIEDASTEHPVRRTAADAERPLYERRDRDADDAPRPATMLSRVSHENTTIRIEIPHRRVHALAAAFGLIPTGIAIWFGLSLVDFFKATRTPEPVAWMFLGFLTLFFVILPAGLTLRRWLRSRRGARIVLASAQGIEVQERGAWRMKTIVSHAAQDILDVDFGTRETAVASARRAAEHRVRETSPGATPAIGPRTQRIMDVLSSFATSRGIVIKTRQGITAVGGELPDDEVRYLHSLIRQALSGLTPRF